MLTSIKKISKLDSRKGFGHRTHLTTVFIIFCLLGLFITTKRVYLYNRNLRRKINKIRLNKNNGNVTFLRSK